MIDNEPKSPYFSMRVHVSEMDTQKQMGQLKRSVEVTFGNLETVTIRNKADISEVIHESTVGDKVLDAWEDVTKKFEGKGYHFIKERVSQ